MMICDDYSQVMMIIYKIATGLLIIYINHSSVNETNHWSKYVNQNQMHDYFRVLR